MSQGGDNKMSGRSRRSRVGLVLVAALCAALLAAVPAGAGGYSDATGDSGAAPDITGLAVAGDETSGQLTFQIAEANPMAANSTTELDLDSDANSATGDPRSRGADYAFQIDPTEHSFGFWHWNGLDWVDTSYATVRITASGSGFTISVNKSEVGNAAVINFGAVTFMNDSEATDSAPDDGLWNYSFHAHGPNIVSVLVATKPASGPRAGKLFTVTPTGLTLPPSGRTSTTALLPDRYTCTATLGAKRLVGVGTGGCTFNVPKKKARGKRLVVHLKVQYLGATKSVDFPFVVR
jgi:hypothetical protein